MNRQRILILALFSLLLKIDACCINIIKFEPAIIEVDYMKRTVLDTLNSGNDYRNTVMTLRVGKNTSSFFSPQKVWQDSLMHFNFDLEYQLHREAQSKGINSLGGRERERIYKNYPAGSLTATNNFDMCHWIYTELWEKPEWILRDSIATVIGMECQLAECNYRGRTWFALFTTEIPVSDGPWKLCGLPGLILKAWDSKYHYVFEATGAIRTENLQDVGIYHYLSSDFFRTTRDKYYTDWYIALHEDLGYKIVHSGAFNFDPSSIPFPRKLPHSDFDFEETDYEHREPK